MSRFFTILKMNMKLILRNKGFLFFLMMAPIVSTIILGIKTGPVLFEEENAKSHIIELEDATKRAVYYGDTTAFIIKVYDASKTKLSEYLLNQLAETGMFSVCRMDVADMTEEEIIEQAKKDAFDDRAGTLLYLKKNFDEAVLDGNYEKALLTFDVSEDERWEVFEEECNFILTQMHQLKKATGADETAILEILDGMEEELPQKEVVSLSGKKDIALTAEQAASRDIIGYAFAILTLGFLFCGVCVAHTVIEEQENKVYTRMMLSGIGQKEYMGVKLVITIFISVLQTAILGICLFVTGNIDFGIDKMSFFLLIFFLGLIFGIISLCTGVLTGNVMASNYAVFGVWSISALLAGLYFPLDGSSDVLKAISYLMPQKWFMRAAEMLLSGDKNVYSMILYITAAYLIVIMSIGGVGLKIKRSDA